MDTQKHRSQENLSIKTLLFYYLKTCNSKKAVYNLETLSHQFWNLLNLLIATHIPRTFSDIRHIFFQAHLFYNSRGESPEHTGKYKLNYIDYVCTYNILLLNALYIPISSYMLPYLTYILSYLSISFHFFPYFPSVSISFRSF